MQQVQHWDTYICALADCGCPSGTHLPAAAYTQFPVEAGICLNDPIAQGEVEEALQKPHNGQAKGADGMSAELLRYAKGKYEKGEPMPQHLLAPSLTTLLNSAFRQGALPASFNSSLITPVFKKGDFFDTANHRPIAVTAPIMRLYAVILTARLMAFAEEPAYGPNHRLALGQNYHNYDSINCAPAVCLAALYH